MTSPVYAERFANPAWTDRVTVPAGAGTGPATDQWQLAGGWARVWPPFTAATRTIMRFYDPDRPDEIIRGTALTAGGLLSVTRADQGTPAVAHAPGFTLENVISPDGLGALAQGIPSAHGLVVRTVIPMRAYAAGTATALNPPLSSLAIPAGEAADGALYEAVIYGYFQLAANSGTDRTFYLTHTWNGTTLIATNGPTPGNFANFVAGNRVTAAQQCRWRIHAYAQVAGPLVTGQVEFSNAPNNAVGTAQVPVYLIGSANLGHTVTSPPPAAATWNVSMTLIDAGIQVYVQGGRAWRSA